MPVHVAKRGDQYCVEEPDGSTVKCHSSKAKADAHARAINANIEKAQSIIVFKGEDGLRHAILITSNSYEDRDEEIIAQKALEAYVAGFKPGTPLLFWHGGQPIGEVIHAEMRSRFLVEVARELLNKIIDLSLPGEEPFLVERKDVWDMIEENKGIWGMSPGFLAKRGDEDDQVFDAIHIFERSILLRENAANWFTYAAV
jgi:hypothetical protein